MQINGSNIAELWEQLDIMDQQIMDLKRQREELDDYITEAIRERIEVVRELEQISDYEPDFG